METIENTPPETEAILRRMKEVRRDLDEGAQEIVERARDMGNWRSYVRDYPWVCLGVALAAGYLIVPPRRSGRQPDARTPAELAPPSPLAGTSSPPLNNVRGRLLTLAGDLLLRGLSTYVTRQANHFIASYSAKAPQEDRP